MVDELSVTLIAACHLKDCLLSLWVSIRFNVTLRPTHLLLIVVFCESSQLIQLIDPAANLCPTLHLLFSPTVTTCSYSLLSTVRQHTWSPLCCQYSPLGARLNSGLTSDCREATKTASINHYLPRLGGDSTMLFIATSMLICCPWNFVCHGNKIPLSWHTKFFAIAHKILLSSENV